MKKIIFCFILFLLFFSCKDYKWDDTVIENNSLYALTFRFTNHRRTDPPLEPGDSVTFRTEAYQRLLSHSHTNRVFFTYSATDDGYWGEFRDLSYWTVTAANELDREINLHAGDWMDSITDIPAGDDSYGRVYTDNPDFTVTFPPLIDAVHYALEITRDEDGNFLVRIF